MVDGINIISNLNKEDYEKDYDFCCYWFIYNY